MVGESDPQATISAATIIPTRYGSRATSTAHVVRRPRQAGFRTSRNPGPARSFAGAGNPFQDGAIAPDLAAQYQVHSQSVLKVLGAVVAVLVAWMLVMIGILVIRYRKSK